MPRVLCIAVPVSEPAVVAPVAAPRRPRSRAVTIPPPADALVELAPWCEQFSPVVGRDDRPTAGALFLQIDRVSSLFGGEVALARQLARGLFERRMPARLAVADSIGAAWAVAGCQPVARASMSVRAVACRGLPRRAADGRPSLVVLPSGVAATQAALAPLPVVALRLDAPALGWLAELGIVRIEQFARLPRSGLATRFGPAVLRRWDQALGLAPEAIVVAPAVVERAAERTWEYPLTTAEQVTAGVVELLRPLVEQLGNERLGVLRWLVQLRPTTGSALDLTLGVFRPTISCDHLVELFQLRLEAVCLPGPIEQLRVALTNVAPLEYRQGLLFADSNTQAAAGQVSLAETEQHLHRLVDRLSSRLGWDTVVSPRLLPDAQPEYAWISRGWLTARCGRASGASSRIPAARRPVQLLRRPLAIDVRSLDVDGAPSSLLWRNQEYGVHRAWGPERIETGWWRGVNIRRDYYWLELTTGAWWWLFRERHSGRWYLHGWE